MGFCPNCSQPISLTEQHACIAALKGNAPRPSCVALREELKAGAHLVATVGDKNRELENKLSSLRARIEDTEGIRVAVKHDRFDGINDPFIEYQAARMSKGKLCEHIALAVQKYLKGEG